MPEPEFREAGGAGWIIPVVQSGCAMCSRGKLDLQVYGELLTQSSGAQVRGPPGRTEQPPRGLSGQGE